MTEFFISTPIYYVNDAPHLGHAYSTINADAFARWRRGMGEKVFFLTGTDEHGQKVSDAAHAASMSLKEWTDTYARRFENSWKSLLISYDDFIRTTEDRHSFAVRKFLQVLFDNGYIYLGKYVGSYCVSCEAYYSSADAADGNCPVHKRLLTQMEEENYFFRLSAFQELLLDWYKELPDAVIPDFRRNEALAFIKGGLDDISISRSSVTWGITLPWDETQVCYVWFDALVNYLTGIGYGQNEELFKTWWANSHHVLGKDIVRFHCVWWPAMCMAAGISPPTRLLVHGWLLVHGEKMAKSGGNGVDPISLVESFGADTIRYFLLREYTLGSDGDFSLNAIESRYDTDLANNIGNLVSRVTNIVEKSLGGVAPGWSGKAISEEKVDELVSRAVEAWYSFSASKALEEVQALVKLANSTLEDRAPWKLSDAVQIAEILGDALAVVQLVGVLVSPALVISSSKILSAIGVDSSEVADKFKDYLAPGSYHGAQEIKKSPPIFPRIKNDIKK